MDHRRRSLLALLLAVGAGCLGTQSDGGAEPETTTEESSPTPGTSPEIEDESLAELVAGNTAFALALHRELVAESPDENLFASPYSISAALAMTWAGARGETETAMADALRFRLGQDGLHPAFEALTTVIEPNETDAQKGDTTTDDGGESTTGDEMETTTGDVAETTTDGEDEQGFQLRVANALWGQDGFPFDESFLETLADHYGAGMHEVDFGENPEAARETINEWVADATEGKIEDLLPEGVIDTLTRLVVTNAIYFKATWAKTFEEEATSDRSFTNLDGSTTELPMMSQTESFPYAEVEGHQILELPYVGGEVSMVVVLPAEGRFGAFERDLDRDALTGLLEALDGAPGTVALPKFTFESAFGLKDALSALGMGVAFDPEEANFDGMVEDEGVQNLYVKDALHESFVAVDEEGTEAAAATGVVIDVESAIQPEFEMIVDRPFLFFIRHRETNAVVFSGRVVDGEGFAE
jgi:serpin B